MKRRALLNRGLFCVLVSAPAAMPIPAVAQAGARAANVVPGPTMAETKSWLETEAPTFLRTGGTKLDKRYGILTVEHHGATDVRLDSCALSWTSWSTFELKSQLGDKTDSSSRRTAVPLKDLDLNGFTVLTDSLLTSAKQFVHMRTRAAVGKTITTSDNNGAPRNNEEIANLYVTGPDEAARIITAIKRGAILCGAPASPF
jgi:hypothetical protein